MTADECRNVALTFVKLMSTQRNNEYPHRTKYDRLTEESKVAALYELAAQQAELNDYVKRFLKIVERRYS